MASTNYLRLRHNDGEDAYYLELRDHPHELVFGVCKRTIDVHALIDEYHGPALYLDFDENNRCIGIEILYPASDDDE